MSGEINSGAAFWDPIADATAALAPISERGIRVQEGWYQADLRQKHVTVWMLEHAPDHDSDDECDAEGARLQINIWSDCDESALMREIISLMRRAGWGWESSFNDTDPENCRRLSAARFIKTIEL